MIVFLYSRCARKICIQKTCIHRYVLTIIYTSLSVLCKCDDRLFTYVSYIPKVPSGKGEHADFGYFEATPPTATFYWLQVHRRPWVFPRSLEGEKTAGLWYVSQNSCWIPGWNLWAFVWTIFVIPFSNICISGTAPQVSCWSKTIGEILS